MIRGTPKVDAIALMKVAVDFTGRAVRIEPSVAFIDSTNGQARGSAAVQGLHLSKATMEAVEALRTALEEDVANILLTGQETQGAVTASTGLPPSLGALYQDDTVPSG